MNKNPRMQKMREERLAAGLVPLRITEQWLTQAQHDALKPKILELIAEAKMAPLICRQEQQRVRLV